MADTSVIVSTTLPVRKVHMFTSQPYGFVAEDLNMPVIVRALPKRKRNESLTAAAGHLDGQF